MDDIDKKAWKILFKRAGKTLCYLAGSAVFGYAVFYLAGIVRESEYSEMIGMAILIVLISSIAAFALSVFALKWKNAIKDELLSKSEEFSG